jgi:citrate synthase
MLHETTKKFLEGFRYNAHPMGMFISTVAALSTVYPDAATCWTRRSAGCKSTG